MMTIQDVFGFMSAHSGLLSGMSAGLAALSVWWLSRYFTPRSETRVMWRRVDGLDGRVGVLEKGQTLILSRLESLPDGDDMADLRRDIQTVQGKQDALSAQMDGLTRSMGSLEKHTLLMTQRLMEDRHG